MVTQAKRSDEAPYQESALAKRAVTASPNKRQLVNPKDNKASERDQQHLLKKQDLANQEK